MVSFNKIKWILGIVLVFLIVLATNLIDKRNFETIHNSIITIYEDRIIASDLIFQLQTYVHTKEVEIIRNNIDFLETENARVNASIQNSLKVYETTKLTNAEETRFLSLKKHFDALWKLEKASLADKTFETSEMLARIERLKEDLQALSTIQLEESRREMKISNKAISSIEFFTQLELYYLIILAILIQVVILYKPKNS